MSQVNSWASFACRRQCSSPLGACAANERASVLFFFRPWYIRDCEDGCSVVELWSDGEPLIFVEAAIWSEGTYVAASSVVARVVGH